MKKNIIIKVTTIFFIVLLVSVAVILVIQELNPKIIVKEDYKGPILPLHIFSETDDITVERKIVCDYSNYSYSEKVGENAERKIVINDYYNLTNSTEEDQILNLIYGFPGRYSSDMAQVPKLKIDGKAITTSLVIGDTPIRYKEKYISVSDRKNQITLNNRECFELLLKDGGYLDNAWNAYENEPTLSEPVTVYKFEYVGHSGNNKKMENPGVKMFFALDSEKTTIFTYEIDYCGEENGLACLGFDVPLKGKADYGRHVYVIAVGEKLNIQEVKCYNQRLNDKETDEFAYEYVEYETSFEEVLNEITELYKEDQDLFSNVKTIYDSVGHREILQAGKKHIIDLKEIDNNGQSVIQLENCLFDINGDYRVFYKTAEVMLPANSTIEMVFEYEKLTGIKNIDGENYDGIEIMTSLGSEVEFEKQTLKVIGLDEESISEHTTGEKLEQGENEVMLDDEYFEIYLKVPEKIYNPKGWWNREL